MKRIFRALAGELRDGEAPQIPTSNGAEVSEPKPAIRELTEQESATVLHALRIYQHGSVAQEFSSCDHFDDQQPLTKYEIDDLCEAINVGEIGVASAKPRKVWTAEEIGKIYHDAYGSCATNDRIAGFVGFQAIAEKLNEGNAE